ncbi:hypothetical protein CLLI_24420 [Clostridium liquoris]|jgi:hypothetical protein|uniref:Uncharacterized protein n=1 Tax=Clostridium liquoris TaxID=1289519 RepID=A0A2T0B100_9CLOT|nr:hypothetical protein [Clostridium liquoris]PRR77272.1 hypothetical protein CLLI_24420 [Clostridium liquoris]
MSEYDLESIELLKEGDFPQYIYSADNNSCNSSQLDFLKVRNILLIAVNTDIYIRCKDNKVRLYILLAVASLKDEGKYDFDTGEVIKRINIIVKYFKISSPQIINNTVYFKPDMDKIKELLEKSKIEIEEGRAENIIFKV